MAECVCQQIKSLQKNERFAVSLIDESMEEAIIINKISVSDGSGGTITSYVPGAEISAAFSFDTSIQARIAEAAEAIGRYTITTKKNINLEYHTIIKRKKDSKVFRVTSKGDDNATPVSSYLDIRQVEAEEWEIPANE